MKDYLATLEPPKNDDSLAYQKGVLEALSLVVKSWVTADNWFQFFDSLQKPYEGVELSDAWAAGREDTLRMARDKALAYTGYTEDTILRNIA